MDPRQGFFFVHCEFGRNLLTSRAAFPENPMNPGRILQFDIRFAFITILLMTCWISACSSSLGDIPVDLPAEGVSEPVACSPVNDLRFVIGCPRTPYVTGVTAVAAHQALESVATAALGVDCLWAGRIVGIGIGRDGKSTGAPLSGWTISWVGGEPEDPDMLVLDTTGGLCMVQNRCSCVSSGTCPDFNAQNVASAVMPTQDSAAAIVAAYPDDPAGTLYDLVYDGTGQDWTVKPAETMPEPVDVVLPDVESLDSVAPDADDIAADS